MTTESDGGTVGDDGAAGGGSSAPRTTATMLRAAVTEIRRDPWLLCPFAVAGLLVALVDWLRQRDPISVVTPHWMDQTVSLQYSVFPRGTARTSRSVGALVDLELPSLLGAVALEAVVPLAVGTAGWVTMTRVLDRDSGRASLGRYLAALASLTVTLRLFAPVRFSPDSVPLILLSLVVLSLVLVSLFALPGYLAAGYGVLHALGASAATARGQRLQLFGLVLTFGLAAWGLARVPVAGGFLSTAVVAPVQAVSIAVLVRGADTDGCRRLPSRPRDGVRSIW
ncbi:MULTISPECIES: hypothetical protein [Halomicrobium]|uniref:Uncharacterized protein n=2 Tax=Halomicrobium mukohataei TaxID=57705 RepID=C7P433_HALMD|nr:MULTISPECIES: hypothetical protein [Halomicrobium]ACV47855.1 hypothetical protein Hmuk_1741 [Halomicrobium mukohataei DSM 12286]QCD66297.1 hypothetical protein E5139_11830 [Halomicrobium mukohataei]QFR21103.1 hypothetical protein GBQ70_11825 [Halomicrobium sp. ZPS1]